MTVLLLPAEINEKINRGKAIPTPNNMKLKKFVMKLAVDADMAKSTIKDAGLQGNTIAPKKKPKMNAER
jgi:hypothetical protein